MGGQSAIKLCVNRPKNSCSAPGDYGRSNSSDKNQLPEMRAAAAGAAAKRAGLQAWRAWSVLSVDGWLFGVVSEVIGDWHHGTPVFERG